MTADSDGETPISSQPAGISAADKAVARQAYEKVLRGESLTANEQAVLKRVEKAKEEQLRWTYYNSIPQKHWRQMSGRQTKVLHDQARNYGFPIGGPTINLTEFVRAFHDFLAANNRILSKSGQGATSDSHSPALERYREERAKIVRLDRLEREAELLPRACVQEGLGRIAALLRGLGEALQRMFGPEALRLLDEVLDDAEREIQRLFGTADSDSDVTDPPPQEDSDADVAPSPA